MKQTDTFKEEEAGHRQETVAPTEENYSESLDHKALDEEKLSVISFCLEGEEYAIDVADAAEVLKPRMLTEVPHAPGFIKGIISVRGEMVPVMDLKKRLFGAPSEAKPYGRILIASFDDLKAGLIVDRMTGVKEVPLKSLGGYNGGKGGGIPEEFLKGVISLNGKTILLLNTGRIIDFTADEPKAGAK